MTRALSDPEESRRAADTRTSGLAGLFGDVLCAGDGRAAERVVDDALASGLAPEAVQSLVIGPAMVRIGELWQSRVIGVADEHLATSISQRALLRLFEKIGASRVRPGSRERVVLAAVEGQHHVLGLRMVADVLEGAGFDVLYLGEDVPVASLRAFVAQHRPGVVGLSFVFASNVRCLADSLWAIHDVAPDTRVMLGGNTVPEGLRTEGYPWVANTMGVVETVEGLLAGSAAPLPKVIEVLRSQEGRAPWPGAHEGETDVVAARMARSADEAVNLARGHVRRAETYRDLALRDPLTGLPNRRAFDDELRALVENSRNGGALLLIDVDAFKKINDDQGHQSGDGVLCAIARAITDSVRPGDTGARVGGDEFAVLLPGATVATGCEIGDRVRAAVASAVRPAASVSVGVARFARDARLAVLAADTALYQAKRAGRDRVVTTRTDQIADAGVPRP